MGEALITRRGGGGGSGSVVSGTFTQGDVSGTTLSLPAVAGKEFIHIWLYNESSYGVNSSQILSITVEGGVVRNCYISMDGGEVYEATTEVSYDGAGTFTIKNSYRNFGYWSSKYRYIAI